MIVFEYMALAGRCNNPVCSGDKRDGEEVSCVRMEPESVHPADHLCKKCNFWEATPDKQVKVIIENDSSSQ